MLVGELPKPAGLLDKVGLLTKPAYHWKYDIMKKERRGGWECN